MQVLRFRATTNQTLSDRQVGISNIFERELPDDTGMVAKVMSAQLTIFDPKTDAIRREYVFAGQTVEIGGGRYKIVSVEEGTDGPGWVSMQPVA